MRKLTSLNDSKTSREAYRFILKLLVMEGLTAEAGETPVAFAERVDETVQGHGLSSVIAIIEKLEFSREELDENEYNKLSACVSELYRQIVKDKGAGRRFMRRISALDIIR